MDNWGTTEKSSSNDTSRKIILAIIAVLAIIIVIIIVLLYNIKTNTFRILINGKEIANSSNLMQTVDETTYINIQVLADNLGYEYHNGEYKVFSLDADKCYIQSANETASFYLNSNKVCKLKVNNLTEDYDVFNFDKNVIKINEKLYAPLDAIKTGFNLKIQMSENTMSIITLDKLLANIDSSLNSAGTVIYNSLLEEKFDNQKAILYDYIILSKKDSGLYGVINVSGQEIIPNRYKSINFIETTKEFFVTNSLGKMGIIDEAGRNKVEQVYDDIKIINNNPKLYLVKVNDKYGVIDENGKSIVYPEYDSIGIDSAKYKDIQNQHILLDSVIPVSKNGKYGLFNIEGKKVLDLIYDGIGCELTSLEVNGVTKPINPTVAIEECEGIVVKSGDFYGLFSKEGKEMVPSRVTAIYSIANSGVNTYYMVYNNEEIDLIERLIKAGVIKDPNKNENNISNDTTNTINNNVENNITNNNIADSTSNTIMTVPIS